MSETIQWAELEPREKVRLIIEKVMGWRLYDTFDEYHAALWAMGKYVEIGYPVAFWTDRWNRWSVFYRDEEDAADFNPLEDMSSAWQIVDLCSGIELSMYSKGSQWHCKLWHKEQAAIAHANTPQEAICIAALRACGVEVE